MHRSSTGIIKGKSARNKPKYVIDNLVKTQDKSINWKEEITLSLDILKVNSLDFVANIVHDLSYRLADMICAT